MTAPTLDRELTAVIYRAAADTISRDGLWQDMGPDQVPDNGGGACAANAICLAAYRLHATPEVRAAALAQFAAGLGLAVTPGLQYEAVIGWNDAIRKPDPTAYVVAALHQAADRVLAVTS